MQRQPLTKIVLSLLLGVLFSLSPGLAQAACSFTISDLNFGSVNLLGASTYDSTATVSISCTNTDLLSLTYRICLNLNSGGVPATGSTRNLANGSSRITYQLFQDANRTVPWGSNTSTGFGNPPQVNMLVLPGVTLNATRTIYGRILGPQATAPGGLYTSLFSGAGGANFTYAPLALATACSNINQNPTRPQFTVRANVDRTCNVNALPMNFGTHGVIDSVVDATSSLSVTCSTGLPYTISLNNGETGTAPDQRRMTRGNQAVIYGLYQNAARSRVWGPAADQGVGSVGTGAGQTFPIYGRIVPQTTPSQGVYNDTVVVTVTY